MVPLLTQQGLVQWRSQDATYWERFDTVPERQEGGADAWIKPDASAGEAAVELSMATPMRDVPVFFFNG